jgi:capsular exopolysaccharide synthesis family protein
MNERTVPRLDATNPELEPRVRMTERFDSQPVTQPRTPVDVLRELVRELWRYKWFVPAVAIVVTAVVAYVTMRKPRVYEATATLEYDPHPSQPLGRSIDDSSSRYGYWNNYEFYETQNFLLKSRAVAERVVRELSLHLDPAFNGVSKQDAPTFKGVPIEAAAQGLAGRIRVAQIPDTRIVRVSVQDGDPERAQLLANAIAEAYIEKSLQDRLGSSSAALEWLGNQLTSLKSELESSELALYRFREENESLSASLQKREELIGSQLQAYTATLTQLQTDKVAAQARLSVLRGLVSASADRSQLAAVAPEDGTIQKLASARREAEADFARLSVTYGPSHPAVREATVVLETITKQLESHVATIVDGVEAELARLAQTEAGIQRALDAVNQQGLELSLREIEYSRLERERTTKAELYALVMDKTAETDLTRALRVTNARVVERALKPMFAVSPKVRTAVTLGLMLGLLLGLGVAFIASQLDNKVRGASDLEERGLTVLGIIPEFDGSAAAELPYGRRRRRRAKAESSATPDLIVHNEPRSTVAECCRTIRTNLTFQSADNPIRIIGVTSALPRDGKTTVAISLAIALAQSGKRVLIIDTDLRKPRLHKAFKLPPSAGVTSVLAGESTLEQATQSTGVPGLSLLQCGPLPPNPSELLHTKRFAELAKEARERYDSVVFDTPPLGAVTDPAIISSLVDGMLLVVRARVTTRAGVDSALRQLRAVSAPLLGGIINDVNLAEGSYGPYYAYYRGYYAEEPPTGTKREAQPTA